MAGLAAIPQKRAMLSSGELLARLQQRGIKRADIARTLGVDPARVTEMYKGQRRLLLDEAKKLSDKYELNNAPAVSALSEPIARLAVIYLSRQVGRELAPEDPLTGELALDLQALSKLALSPAGRDAVDLVQGFFQGQEVRRQYQEASETESTRAGKGRNHSGI